MIRIYRVIRANREEISFVRGNHFGPKVDANGNISLRKCLYTVDPNKSTNTTRSKWLFFKQDAKVYYYREGNPAPMDPLDFAAESVYTGGTLQRFADATFISQLWSEGMDFKTLLLILAVVGNMVLGGIIYSLVK